MKKHIIIVAVIAFLFLTTAGCFKKDVVVKESKPEQKGYTNITSQELRQKIERKEKFLLLDVRTKREYNDGHIKRAINIPHTEIESRSKELGCKCQGVIVYCRSGVRSVTATKTLLRLGYRKTKNLSGGIQAWEKSGGEVVK